MNNLQKAFENRKQERDKNSSVRNRSFQRNAMIDVPRGLYEKCNKCGEPVNMKHMVEEEFICKHCGEHFKIRAIDRINLGFGNLTKDMRIQTVIIAFLFGGIYRND